VIAASVERWYHLQVLILGCLGEDVGMDTHWAMHGRDGILAILKANATPQFLPLQCIKFGRVVEDPRRNRPPETMATSS
jgi:hypothetical protein